MDTYYNILIYYLCSISYFALTVSVFKHSIIPLYFLTNGISTSTSTVRFEIFASPSMFKIIDLLQFNIDKNKFVYASK